MEEVIKLEHAILVVSKTNHGKYNRSSVATVLEAATKYLLLQKEKASK